MSWSLYHGNALDAYGSWPAPDLIISDGAYGIGGFRGDPFCADGLKDWYLPHIREWSRRAKPSTSLWFWNTEVGWATVHPLLVSNGWEYVQLVVWDKGIGHVAGNVNGKTIRKFPVVTEVSALYRKKLFLETADGRMLDARSWLRAEWERSTLPLYMANRACGVRSAATRKYLTSDRLWYWPPGSAVSMMAQFCLLHGRPTNRPYFSIDGKNPPAAGEWDSLRPVWNHRNGLTNVWSRIPLANEERLKKISGNSAMHLNQKPLDLMKNQILAASDEGNAVWEPFGGLASASVAAVLLGRNAYAAETDGSFFRLAKKRLEETERPPS